jgi:hypothetical protein
MTACFEKSFSLNTRPSSSTLTLVYKMTAKKILGLGQKKLVTVFLVKPGSKLRCKTKKGKQVLHTKKH